MTHVTVGNAHLQEEGQERVVAIRVLLVQVGQDAEGHNTLLYEVKWHHMMQ
jgi:hypothetical protein